MLTIGKMNKDLIDTNWLLIDSEGESGWTIYVGANYPGDFLRFQDNRLINTDFRLNAHIPHSYSSSDTQILIEDHTWNIGLLTQEKLIISYLGKEFHYRKIKLQSKNQIDKREIESRLVSERWSIKDSLDYASNVSIFLKEGFKEEEFLFSDYSILLSIGYNRSLLAYPNTGVKMLAWKIIRVEEVCFLGLYDLVNSFQNLELVSISEEEIVFIGKQELRLLKQN